MSDDENIEIEGNFTPIVNLPLVRNELEDAEILFEREVTAYLYDTTVIPNEWKERGIGKLKILKEKDSSRYRILMRRNQVKKVCLNHLVHKHFHAVKHNKKGTTLVWFTAKDWSDEIHENCCFAAKFTLKEDAEEFCKQIDKIVKELKSVDESNEKDSLEELEKDQKLPEKAENVKLEPSNKTILEIDKKENEISEFVSNMHIK